VPCQPAAGLDFERDNGLVRPPTPPTTATTSLLALGFATAVAQAVLLREGMAALGGSELAWGAVLALWLWGMGAGAWVGTRHGGRALAALAPALVSVLTAAGVVLMRAAPALTGMVTGEAPTTWRGLWLWVAAVVVPAAVGGWSFPVAAAALRGPAGAASAYALESGGAALGGLCFTFLLAQQGSVTALCVAAGVSLAAWLAASGRPWLAVLPLAAGVIAAAPGDRILARAGWRWSGRTGELAAWRETRQQRLELSTGTPATLYADGRLLASFPDPYRVAARAHLALLLHPKPTNVLLVGGTADGSVPAMLREPGVRITVVEEDATLARLLPAWFGPPLAKALADPRVSLVGSDPLRAVRRAGPWDLIVLFDGDPTTLRHDRTRTVEFFRTCARVLNTDGVLVVRVGVGDTYLGGAGGRLLAVTAATLREAFGQVLALPGEEVLLVAGREGARLSADPSLLAERLRGRGVVDPEFGPEMIPLLVDPGRAATLEAFLASHPAPGNRARHPRVVLLAAALHEARGSPPLLAAARALEAGSTGPLLLCLTVVLAVLLVRGMRGASLGVEAAAVVGFASMAWWLLLLAGWQATMGSVYAEVGALSAAFMAGLVGGSAAARRWSSSGPRYLACVLAAGAGISLLIAAGAPLAWPRATIVPLLLLAGLLTGAAFPAVALLAGSGETRRGAGRGFAADEAGAGLAALAVGLLVLPWAGMAAVGVGIAFLQGGTAAALGLSARRRRG
jgi:predicted membrane-bound spermidine synthase